MKPKQHKVLIAHEANKRMNQINSNPPPPPKKPNQTNNMIIKQLIKRTKWKQLNRFKIKKTNKQTNIFLLSRS